MKTSCKYCKNKIKNLPLIDSNDDQENRYPANGITVVIMDNHLNANGWFDEFVGIKTNPMKINFCPMCGREL